MKERDGSFDYDIKVLDGEIVNRLNEMPFLSMSTYEHEGEFVQVRGIYGVSIKDRVLSYRREESGGHVIHMLNQYEIGSTEGEKRIVIADDRVINASGYKHGLGVLEAHEVIVDFVKDISYTLQGDA